MLIKDIKNIRSFIAGDRSILKEILHPKNDNIQMGFSLAHAKVPPGQHTLPHTLKSSVEVYFILKGRGIMHIEKEESEVREGNVVYIPKGTTQWIENKSQENLEFLCIVSPPWSEKDEVIYI